MTITSEIDGQLTVTLRMVTAGQADQASRRGGRQSSRQERGPGTQAPFPAAPPAPSTPAPAPASAPAPARRGRRRGPAAAVRDDSAESSWMCCCPHPRPPPPGTQSEGRRFRPPRPPPHRPPGIEEEEGRPRPPHTRPGPRPWPTVGDAAATTADPSGSTGAGLAPCRPLSGPLMAVCATGADRSL